LLMEISIARTAPEPTLLKDVKGKKKNSIPILLQKSVDTILRDIVTVRDIDRENPFYIADLGELERQYFRWKRLLPRIRPFYAVKCNPDPAVLLVLANCGAGFDCASKPEVKLALSAGVPKEDIIYANPCKQASHIKYAASRGVNTMTFDNVEELHKIKGVNPSAKLVLRILTDDSKSKCRFGVKFGAPLETVPNLLAVAKELDLNVIGISFHVGSGCFDASAFRDAVVRARKAFDIGASFGYDFELLDVGGGFPGNRQEGLQREEIASVLGPAVDELFDEKVRVIAEPGRYFVSSAYTIAVNVIAKRTVPRDTQTSDGTANDHPTFKYYINDGVYGAFNCVMFDHVNLKPVVLKKDGRVCYDMEDNSPTFQSSIWGPTCDSIDLIGREFYLPELNISDWLVFQNMGAYTMAAASNFNGFKKSGIIYTNTNYLQ